MNVNVSQLFLKELDNKIILEEIRVHLTDLTTKHLSDLTNLIMFFILVLLDTVSKIGMYGLLYILTYSLKIFKTVLLISKTLNLLEVVKYSNKWTKMDILNVCSVSL